MKVTDNNGKTLSKNVKKEEQGWGVTVWFGGLNGLGTNVRRYYYETRSQAQNGDISDDIGKRGRVA